MALWFKARFSTVERARVSIAFAGSAVGVIGFALVMVGVILRAR